MKALALQGGYAAGPALRGHDFVGGQQAHQLGARSPVFTYHGPMLSKRIPHGVQVFYVVGILAADQCPIPALRAPVVDNDQLAPVFRVDQALHAFFFTLFFTDHVGVVAQTSGTVNYRKSTCLNTIHSYASSLP